MTPVHTPPERQQHARPANGRGMKPLAAELIHAYQQPALGTAVAQPHYFPRRLWLGLWGGALAGAIIGLLFGRLLFAGTLAPRGWEAIFSLGPFTLHVFWTLLGVAAGLAIGGVLAIFLTDPDPG